MASHGPRSLVVALIVAAAGFVPTDAAKSGPLDCTVSWKAATVSSYKEKASMQFCWDGTSTTGDVPGAFGVTFSYSTPGFVINETAYTNNGSPSLVNASGYDPAAYLAGTGGSPGEFGIRGIYCDMFGPCSYSGTLPNAAFIIGMDPDTYQNIYSPLPTLALLCSGDIGMSISTELTASGDPYGSKVLLPKASLVKFQASPSAAPACDRIKGLLQNLNLTASARSATVKRDAKRAAAPSLDPAYTLDCTVTFKATLLTAAKDKLSMTICWDGSDTTASRANSFGVKYVLTSPGVQYNATAFRFIDGIGFANASDYKLDSEGFPDVSWSSSVSLMELTVGKAALTGNWGPGMLAECDYDFVSNTWKCSLTRVLKLLCSGELGVGLTYDFLVGTGTSGLHAPPPADVGRFTAGKNAKAACAKII